MTTSTGIRATYTTPGGPDLPADAGLAHLVAAGLARDPDGVALSELVDRTWHDRTWRRLDADVTTATSHLHAAGLSAGDRLAILGRTSYAWAVADLAAATLGVVVVPIFPTSSAAQMRHVLDDSGARVCLAERGRRADVPTGRVLPLEGMLDPARGGPPAPAAVRPDDIASIVYTSGTTGVAKGCVLTHRNMYVAAAAVVGQSPALFAHGPASTIVGLPLAHVFGRTVLQAGLYSGSRTGLAPAMPEMIAELAAFEPTWLAVVPYALEKLRKAIVAGAEHPGRHPLLGAELAHVICGGARLDPAVVHFYAEQGVTVLQAYGLTESATSVTVSVPESNRAGAVGRPVPGTTVAVADDGELLVRGRQCSPGYWPHVTPSPDGWLHTGDLAEIDDTGIVTITGRRKEILVTSGGKNVAPVPLEDRIRLSPLVADAMVVAEGRPYVTALVTVDPGACRAHDDPALLAEVGRAVEAANRSVSRAESIRRFAVLDRQLTVSDGHLTPTLKLRRDAVEAAFRHEVEEMYR